MPNAEPAPAPDAAAPDAPAPDAPAARDGSRVPPLVDRALRGAAIAAVLGAGALGLLRPRAILLGGTAWLAFLFFALSGAGYLVVRLRRAADPDFGLRAAWGAAAYIAVAGPLVAAGVCSRPAVLALLALGAAGFAWRELTTPAPAWLRIRDAARAARRRPGLAALAAVIALAAAAQLVGAVAALDRNPWDDDLAYTPLMKRLLDAGDLVEPFSFRRLGAYGGQTLLGALVAARGGLESVHLLDRGLAFGLTLLLVTGLAGERRTHPVWVALLALVLVLLPDISINTATHWTGAALFLALYRAAARDDWAAAGLLGAAACTLRQNFIAVVVLFAGLVLAQRLLAARRAAAGRAEVRGAWRAAWRAEARRWRLTAGVATLVIVPWWIAAWRSSETFLFPILGGTWNRELSLRPEVFTWTDGLFHTAWTAIESTPLAVVPVLFALLAIADETRPGRPLRALFVAAALGLLLLVHAFAGTEPSHLWRYAFGFGIALTAALVLEVGADRDRAVRLPPIGRWLLLAALGLQLLVARAPVTERVRGLALDVREAAAYGRRGDPSARAEERRYSALQAAIPAGAPVVVLLDDPRFLDFRRNRIANLDTAGYASVAVMLDGREQQLPAFRGAEPLRAYLVAAGYRYAAFVRSERSRYFYRRDFWLWRIFNDYDFFQIMSAYQIDMIDSLAELATTTRVLHDADGLVALDLAAPLRPASTRPPLEGSERYRRGEWFRELAEREGLRDVWSLTSRYDVRFDDGFSALMFVPREPEELADPTWFEDASGAAVPARAADPTRTLRLRPLRPLYRRAHVRVRGHGGAAMRLVLRGSVALRTVHTRPRLDVSLDGELLTSAVADARGRYAVDVVVPAGRLTDGWHDVYLVSSTISEPEREARDVRVSRLEHLEWTPAAAPAPAAL